MRAIAPTAARHATPTISDISPSSQALACGKTAKLRRCYYDFADYLRTNPAGNVPYTPSVPLLYGTQESIKMLKAEG